MRDLDVCATRRRTTHCILPPCMSQYIPGFLQRMRNLHGYPQISAALSKTCSVRGRTISVIVLPPPTMRSHRTFCHHVSPHVVRAKHVTSGLYILMRHRRHDNSYPFVISRFPV